MRRLSILLLPLTLRGVAAQTDLTRHRHPPQWRRHRHRGYGKEIIVDMGFNIGQDTAAYLELGYDVVAVEASPRLLAWANQSEPFKSALASSRLTLLNRLVVEKDSPRATIPFFMGSHTERSVPYSCDTPPCEEVQVPTISCDKLVVDYSPLYIKIDTDDKGDVACIDAILASMRQGASPPKYISVEAAPRGLPSDKIKELAAAGYDSFKYMQGAKSKGGPLYHGAGSGPFGEFVFDQTTKYGWHDLKGILAEHRTGDLHMKHSSAWTHRASNEMLLAWRHSAGWPLN